MECQDHLFDTAKIMKKFYNRFQQEHALFTHTIQGFAELDGQKHEKRAWYTSVILNRLMFLYFLQHQGLLDTQQTGMRDGDTHYLRNRLHMTQKYSNTQSNHTYYQSFLLPLFYAGLSKYERTPEIKHLLGNIPYLHPNLFSPHIEECEYSAIEIPDAAFERIFDFFDEFQWMPQNKPLSDFMQINPDILGHVFEKYVNQQQMGAYYTQEDVTTYIAKNTILPAIFDAAVRISPHTFGPEGALWKLLQHNPARYIPDAIRTKQRLSSETEHEYRARQAYYQQLQTRITQGELCCIDDCITYNLDIAQFLQDILQAIDKNAARALFSQCLTQLTILDPTCGSGAFLCAAIRTLVPLYQACQQPPIQDSQPTTLSILTSIITTNLYGLDIMEEATELCKLRLFLMLIGEVKHTDEMAALANITFHIRAGNTLVGYPGKTPETWVGPFPNEREQLDKELAREYGIAVEDEQQFAHWRTSHKPFHWHYEFPEIVERGGFACILGNPPYVEYTAHKFVYCLQHFSTLNCGNLYPCVIERSRSLLAQHGRLGMIVPLAAFATRNMLPLLEGLQQWFAGSWISFYHFRPSMLFCGDKVASIPTAILLARCDGPTQRFSTSILKWASQNRHLLFSTLNYCQITAPHDPINRHYYAKFGWTCENAIMEKIQQQHCVKEYLTHTPSENRMFYRSAGGLYWKVFLNFPWPYQTTSNKQCVFQPEYERDVFVALFNSSLFWWYYSVTFDTFNLKDYMLFAFRFTYPDDRMLVDALRTQCKRLMADFCTNAKHLKRAGTGSYTLYARKSKHILDDIDALLAHHYGLSNDELDFIIQYDVKYRMGSSTL
jgi:hypothetical protein